MKPDVRLDSKVAVVTGAGRGLGKACARLLAQAGAAVVAAARTAAELEQTVAEIALAGGRAIAVPADVSRWRDMERLADAARAAFGPADVVVANAGVVNPLGAVWDLDPDAWTENVSVNLVGAFNTARAFLPDMRQRRSGVMIFISTGLAVEAMAGFSAYGASKAGLEQLIRILAAEVDQEALPIRIHGLYPGVVDTSMQAQLRSTDEGRLPEVGRFRQLHTDGALRPPEEPAALVCWLAAARAADLHGSMASVSDPRTIWRMRVDLGVCPAMRKA